MHFHCKQVSVVLFVTLQEQSHDDLIRSPTKKSVFLFCNTRGTILTHCLNPVIKSENTSTPPGKYETKTQCCRPSVFLKQKHELCPKKTPHYPYRGSCTYTHELYCTVTYTCNDARTVYSVSRELTYIGFQSPKRVVASTAGTENSPHRLNFQCFDFSIR